MHYDEFGLFHENAEEFGIPWDGPPTVRRTAVAVAEGQRVSALVWGTADPELVLLHGGAQNAHTWDTVALALDRPLVAFDLPGHGHSDWREDRRYWPVENAEAFTVAIPQLAPEPRGLVGMSLGGLTAIAYAARNPERVPKLVLVDVTPGVDREKASPIAAFIAGPERFESFDEILQRTIEFNPTRTESSLRRGILHNAKELDDGGWSWRYDRFEMPEGKITSMPDFGALWADVDRLSMPVLLALGADSWVVDENDVAAFRERCPQVVVEKVEGAGHSIQGDKPLELTALIQDFVLG